MWVKTHFGKCSITGDDNSIIEYGSYCIADFLSSGTITFKGKNSSWFTYFMR
jgi:hypothetical protein